MSKNTVVACMCVAAVATGLCRADDLEDLARQNAELRKRVETLEKELSQLKQIVLAQNGAVTAGRERGSAAATSTVPSTDRPGKAAAPAPAAPPKKNVSSNLDIEIYGFLKADASYDTSRSHPGNYVVYLDREDQRNNDDEFNVTANETRVGMRIKGPAESGFSAAGRLEVDFYGNYAAENKAKIQMRHAYLTLDWPGDHFGILAGQTSDVISPLVPRTLNYTVLWDAGNIGYRHPQVRVTKDFQVQKDINVNLQAAISRTIGRNDLTGSETGEDAGFPTLQGRIGLTFPGLGYKPATIGFSGHYGTEEYDPNTGGSNKDFESWSLNLDLNQPVYSWLTVKGELFTGRDLDSYFGGIGQGVNTSRLHEIDSRGGWVAATLGPWDNWSFNIGCGIDDVDSDDVSTGDRVLNRSVFGNAIYHLDANTEIGVELSHWKTEYRGPGDADDLRFQGSFIYRF